MKTERKQYEAPEVRAIGPASRLTLGAISCYTDGHCCCRYVAVE